jgi:hypothetical protein
VYDGGTSAVDVAIERIQVNQTGGIPSVIGSASSTVGNGYQSLTITPNEIINNSLYSYVVSVTIPSAGTSFYDSTYRLRDVQINYKVSKAD